MWSQPKFVTFIRAACRQSLPGDRASPPDEIDLSFVNLSAGRSTRLMQYTVHCMWIVDFETAAAVPMRE